MLGQMYIFKLHMKVLEKPCFPRLEMAKCFFFIKKMIYWSLIQMRNLDKGSNIQA